MLNDPNKRYYLCKNIYIDHILDNMVSNREMLSLNAMDYTLYKATSEKEVIELLLKNKKTHVEFEKIKFFSIYPDS